MARPTKKGLDYFPFDINFFDDDKVVFASKRFGVKGEIIAIRLLCRIYKNGYFTNWDNELAELFATRVGENVTSALVNDVVDELVKRDFFNKAIFNRFGILTSKGIQERYLNVCERMKRKGELIDAEYNCTNNSPNNPEHSENPPEKGKESKGKESKGNYFRLRQILHNTSISVFFKENFATFSEQWFMKNKGVSPDAVFEKMDTDYFGFDFNDNNHIKSTFKSVAERILKEKVPQKNSNESTSKTKDAIDGITEILANRGIKVGDHIQEPKPD